MSLSPEPPERLAEILTEILALSKPTQTSQSKSASDNSSEDFDGYRGEEQSQRKKKKDDTGQRP
jgi:hypothetical protein